MTRTAPPPRRRRRRLPFWAEVPLLLVLAVLVITLVQGFVAQIYIVPSASMETTLHGCPGCDNDRVLADKVSGRLGEAAPGDIVVFRGNPAWAESPEAGQDPQASTLATLWALTSWTDPGEKDFVKRVIAGPGQTVACCDANRVTVDGIALDEPYVHIQEGSPAEQEPFGPVTLGPAELWMMGDNRNNSADSRDHGPVSTGDVVGRVRAVVLPVPRLQWVRSADLVRAAGAG